MRRVAAAFALLVVLAGCADTRQYDPLPKPEGVDDLPPTSTTVSPALDEIALPGVPGTTTTVPAALGPGPVTIVGRVDGPDGPVGGARVRLERVTGAGIASVEVPTAPDGSWNASNVLGGSYRIRAWLAPSLGMTRAQVVFVESPKAKPVVLKLDRFDGLRIDAVLAPPSPTTTAPVNLKVRVTDRQVDSTGIVRAVPRVSSSVTLSGSSYWTVLSSNPTVTDGEGSATFQLQCTQAGPQPLTVVLDTGESQALDLPPCA